MSRKSKPPIALYSALADITRCRILEILKAAPTPVHVLTEAFSISRPAISRHLRVLKAAGLVAEVKKGRENVYAFRPSKLDAAKTWLESISTTRSAETTAEPTAVPIVEAVTTQDPAPPASKPSTEAKPASAPKAPRAARKKPVFADDIAAHDAAAASPPSISQMGFDF